MRDPAIVDGPDQQLAVLWARQREEVVEIGFAVRHAEHPRPRRQRGVGGAQRLEPALTLLLGGRPLPPSMARPPPPDRAPSAADGAGPVGAAGAGRQHRLDQQPALSLARQRSRACPCRMRAQIELGGVLHRQHQRFSAGSLGAGPLMRRQNRVRRDGVIVKEAVGRLGRRRRAARRRNRAGRAAKALARRTKRRVRRASPNCAVPTSRSTQLIAGTARLRRDHRRLVHQPAACHYRKDVGNA